MSENEIESHGSIFECIYREKNSWFQPEMIIRVSNRAKLHDIRQYKYKTNISIRDSEMFSTISRQMKHRSKKSLCFNWILWKWNWTLVSIWECITRDKNCWFQLEMIICVSNRAKAHDVRQYKWMRNQYLYFRSIVWLNILYYLE